MLISVLSLIISIALFQIGQNFYYTHSEVHPAQGGTFIEGVVSDFHFLNPVLVQTDLDRDVMSLVSCSLTRFDPLSNSILDYAADHTLSPDQRTYTFNLRKDVFWHDGRPVTADDVVFTFQEMIQAPDFPNPTLAENFSGVTITKIDEQTVTMTLKKKYAFFIFNTIVGLLPKHILGQVSPADLLTSEFNFQPIGCGPYKVKEVTSKHIKLVANKNYFLNPPLIETVIFRIFQSTAELVKNIDSITGSKDFDDQTFTTLRNDARLTINDFVLPQYVALFFNTDREILRNHKTRLGLQLATDKKSLITKLDLFAQILDTPLLEISQNDWQYQFDASRSDGALFDAGWHYPQTDQVAQNPVVAAPVEDSNPKFITQPTLEKFWATSDKEFYIEGQAPEGSQKIIVNDYELSLFQVGDSEWNYKASFELKNLKEGENKFSIANEKGEFDHLTVFFATTEKERDAWLAKKLAKENTTTEFTEAPANSLTLNPDFRYQDGQKLSLKILVLKRENFVQTAELIAEQWRERGVELILEVLAEPEFMQRMQNHDYDILLSGQNLGYNLDTYTFWHSSEARVNGENLSNLKSSAANAWLEQIRASFDISVRRKRLANLREVLSKEVPAVILYSPVYSYAIDNKVKNFNLGQIALKRDRLAGLANWYLSEQRVATKNLGFWNFVSWFWEEL